MISTSGGAVDSGPLFALIALVTNAGAAKDRLNELEAATAALDAATAIAKASEGRSKAMADEASRVIEAAHEATAALETAKAKVAMDQARLLQVAEEQDARSAQMDERDRLFRESGEARAVQFFKEQRALEAEIAAAREDVKADRTGLMERESAVLDRERRADDLIAEYEAKLAKLRSLAS